MNIQIPKTDFVAHPVGQYEGKIIEVVNKGVVETKFGPKPKVAVAIESEAKMDDGSSFRIDRWFSISSHPKSSLREFRETMLARTLTQEEANDLNSDELLGRNVGFIVVHRENPEGLAFSNVSNIWPLNPPVASVVPTMTSRNVPLPMTSEGAKALVFRLAQENQHATASWVESKLAERGCDTQTATHEDWNDVWPSVRDDVPL